MPTINTNISIGNILTILSIIVAMTLSWGRITSTIDEIKTIRAIDMQRIDRIEYTTEILRDKIVTIEKHNTELSTDIKYIRVNIQEIRDALNNKKPAGY